MPYSTAPASAGRRSTERSRLSTFPPQHKIAERCCGWRESEINIWLRSPVSFTVDDMSPRQGLANGTRR
ncbi:helix-turn-helix transcriptional regulator [Sphingopyxis sp. PET50]|uniref:helix-turn-helix transcriptional regulator n=1 Tax=Sphingopyxis sp. PET50 TaxID=2976533 RepID=UPI00391A0203